MDAATPSVSSPPIATSASSPVSAKLPEDAVDAALDLVRVRARGADDRRRAAGTRDLAASDLRQLVLDEAAPPVLDADDLVAAIERAPGDRADHRVQAGAVAAAREDADSLHRG